MIVALCALTSLAQAEESPDLTTIVGLTVTIEVKTGKMLEAVEVSKVLNGAAAGSIKALTVKVPPQGRLQVVPVGNVVEIFSEQKPLDVAFDKKTNTLAHSPEKRKARIEKEARVVQQLRAKRAKLWPEYSEAEQGTYVAEEKKFLDRVQNDRSALNMKLYETRYYMFLTNMPEQQIAGYITQLDAMYTQLCKAFGIREGANIWRGKCVVIAFVESEQFLEFERTEFKHDAKGAQGIAHSYSNGRVVVTCYRGNDQAFFAHVLVHETSHGFMHRYKSSANVPSWVNEGVADWVAAAVVRTCNETANRQRAAADQARQTGTLGGNFFDDDKNIEAWQYGVAASLVDLMLKDGSKYRAFIEGIKEGLDWQDSLQQTYKLTPVQLTSLYGASIGAPALRP
jgi:hypothetical protein